MTSSTVLRPALALVVLVACLGLMGDAEAQLAQQAQEDSSVKYLETLQSKFVEEQEFEE